MARRGEQSDKRVGRESGEGGATGKDASRLPTWLPWVGLGAVVLLETLLVVAAANPSPHSGGDNAGYLSLAFSLLDRGAYLELWEPGEPLHTKYPPGFALVLAGMMSLGARTWTAFKASSAVFMVAAVGLSYLWVAGRRSWAMALGVGTILAFSDSFVYSSQWVLSDPMFLVLTILALLAWDRAAPLAGSREEAGPKVARGRARAAWVVLGTAAAILAYFTRSAGLPLIVAALGWLALRREWKTLALAAVAFGIPAALWALRSSMAGAPGYVSEFWMINPYDPALGRAGLGDLIGRVVENTRLYMGAAIPAGLTGRRGPATAGFGLLLALLALVGWGRRLRRPGVAELFAPMYLALLLLWPVVWSGDRFALPLFALVLSYAGEALSDGARLLHARAPLIVGAIAVASIVWPSSMRWSEYASQAELCRERVRESGAYGCYQPRMREFVTAARWASVGLPEGSVVLTRKPRTFFVLSEIRSRTYPLLESSEALLAAADSAGAQYVLIDYLDTLGSRYLVPSVHQRPRAFCALVGFGGDEQGIQTQLLGVRDVASRPNGGQSDMAGGVGSLTIPFCPEGYRKANAPAVTPYTSLDVPLLSRLDR